MAGWPKTASGGELGDLLGVSVKTIRSAADQGFIIRASTRGRYEVAASVQKYCEHLREMASGRGDASSAASLAKERARLAKEQGDAVALKNAALRGELIDANEATARWRATLTTLRSRLLAVPSRILGRLPHLTRQEVEIVDGEVRDALEELAGE